MKKKGMIITACLLASVLSVASVSGQEFDFNDPTDGAALPGFVDPLAPQSNTNAASQGALGTAVDGFQSVLGWSDLAFDKWFGYVGIAPAAGTNPLPGIDTALPYLLNLGYATKIGGVYLGAFYSGKIADGNNTVTDTITKTNPWANGAYGYTGTTESTVNAGGNKTNTLNNASVLLGLGNMGIKVGFYEALQTIEFPGMVKSNQQDENGYTATQEYTSYKNTKGFLIPSVSFGIPLSLGNLTLKPSATIAVNIIRNNIAYDFDGNDSGLTYNDNLFYTTASPLNSNTSTGPTGKVSYAQEYGFVQPDITIGAEIGFPSSGTASLSAALEYRTNFNLYAKPDGDGDIGAGRFTSLTGTLDGQTADGTFTTTKTSVNATEQSDWNNRITPSFTYTNALSEKVTLGLGTEIAFTTGLNSSQVKRIATVDTTFTSYNETGSPATTTDHNYTYTATRTDVDGVTKQSWFGIAPELKFGVGYKVNERWSVQGGLGVALPEWNSITTVTTPYNGQEFNSTTTFSDGSTTSQSTITPGSTTGGGINTVDQRKKESYWTTLEAEYSLGFTFNFTPALALDAKISLSPINANGLQNLNLTTHNLALLLTGSF